MLTNRCLSTSTNECGKLAVLKTLEAKLRFKTAVVQGTLPSDMSDGAHIASAGRFSHTGAAHPQQGHCPILFRYCKC